LIGRQQWKIPTHVIVCLEISDRPGRRVEHTRTQFDKDAMKISRPTGHQTLQCSKALGRMRD